MAVDKLVDSSLLDASLADIADAIRTKGGTLDLLTLSQMPQAIANLPSGGGGATLLVDSVVVPTSEDYNVYIPSPVPFPLENAGFAWMVYDDGTVPYNSTKTFALLSQCGYLPAEIFSVDQTLSLGYYEVRPKENYKIKKSDGTDYALTNMDMHSFASGGGICVRTSTETPYTGFSYGSLKLRKVDGVDCFMLTRGNSTYGFMAGHKYICKIWQI